MKLLKSNEEKELLKMKEAEKKAAERIKELEAVERQRQAKIDAAEREHQMAMTGYTARCQEFAFDQPAFVRLCVLIQKGINAERQGQMTFIDYVNQNLRYYNLYEFRDFINKLCLDAAKPPTKKEPDLE